MWLTPDWVTKVVIWVRRLSTSVFSESSRSRAKKKVVLEFGFSIGVFGYGDLKAVG